MAAYKAKRLKEIEGLDILIINEMKAGKCLEDTGRIIRKNQRIKRKTNTIANNL